MDPNMSGSYNYDPNDMGQQPTGMAQPQQPGMGQGQLPSYLQQQANPSGAPMGGLNNMIRALLAGIQENQMRQRQQQLQQPTSLAPPPGPSMLGAPAPASPPMSPYGGGSANAVY